jgi:hypothetical protein
MCDARGMDLEQDRRDTDRRGLTSAESQLASQFPGVSDEVIHRLVHESYHRLVPARVHTYLPILVSREVKAQLRSHPAA